MQRELATGYTLIGNRFIHQSFREFGKFGAGQHPARDVAAVNIEDHIEVVVAPLFGPVEFCYVPTPNLIGLGGNQLRLFVCGVGSLATSFTDFVVLKIITGSDQRNIRGKFYEK